MMSWAAHELESYFIQKHVKARVSYLAILLGCLLPDLFTKLPVYGLSFGILHIKAEHDPWKYHRGWLGVGFTHSLAFGIVFATVVLGVSKSRAWFLGLIIGEAAHVLTDTFDSVGTMLFFPFTTQHYTIGMWAYVSQQGRYGDAAAYYSSLGGSGTSSGCAWRSPAGGCSRPSISSPSSSPTTAGGSGCATSWICAIPRSWLCTGPTSPTAARIFAWSIWARVTRHAPRTLIGAGGLALAGWVGWLLIGRRLWRRAGDPAPMPRRVAPIPVEGREDVLIYAVTAVALVGMGIWLTTPILNWIVGPAFVVAVVSVLTSSVRRWQFRRMPAAGATGPVRGEPAGPARPPRKRHRTPGRPTARCDSA